MSVAGIASTSLFNTITQNVQNKKQLFQQEFQQLGKDLQSGNMSAAQSDLVTLQQNAPQTNASSSSQSTSPMSQEFSQLATDIQSGNTTAAQQDYSTIQQDMQSHAAAHHGHHSHASSGGDDSQSAFSQLMSQLGQALQSGNLTSAQQAYSSLQQEFQQFTQNNGLATSSSSNNLSVSV